MRVTTGARAPTNPTNLRTATRPVSARANRRVRMRTGRVPMKRALPRPARRRRGRGDRAEAGRAEDSGPRTRAEDSGAEDGRADADRPGGAGVGPTALRPGPGKARRAPTWTLRTPPTRTGAVAPARGGARTGRPIPIGAASGRSRAASRPHAAPRNRSNEARAAAGGDGPSQRSRPPRSRSSAGRRPWGARRAPRPGGRRAEGGRRRGRLVLKAGRRSRSSAGAPRFRPRAPSMGSADRHRVRRPTQGA